jgi:hypothetical protein
MCEATECHIIDTIQNTWDGKQDGDWLLQDDTTRVLKGRIAFIEYARPFVVIVITRLIWLTLSRRQKMSNKSVNLKKNGWLRKKLSLIKEGYVNLWIRFDGTSCYWRIVLKWSILTVTRYFFWISWVAWVWHITDNVLEIPVTYFRDDSRGNKQIMAGRGLDGMLYTFVVTSREPIPRITGYPTTVTMKPKSKKSCQNQFTSVKDALRNSAFNAVHP